MPCRDRTSGSCCMAMTIIVLWGLLLVASGVRARPGGHCKDAQQHLVLAHYKEPLDQVKLVIERVRELLPNTTTCVYLYSKGPLNVPELQAGLPTADHFLSLENVGREGHSYITHIVEHYHRLPPRAIFTQAVPDRPVEFWGRLEQMKGNLSSYSFGCLGDLGIMTNCDGTFTTGRMVRIREIWAMTQHALCPPEVHVCSRGSFLASRPAIHSQPRSFYQLIMRYLEADSEHWIHDDIKELPPGDPVYLLVKNGRKTRDNTLFLHVLERMWMTILGCRRPSPLEYACGTE